MPRIIKIGKRKYLAGLTWSTFEEVQNRNSIQAEANKAQADWFATRSGEEFYQIAFCAALQKQNPKSLVSLAASVSQSSAAPAWPWRGRFRLDANTWWYIAIRDDNCVLPDGDFIGTEEQIAKIYESHNQHGDWKAVDGTLLELTSILAKAKIRNAKIGNARKPGPLRKYAAVFSLLLFTITGGSLYWWNSENEKQAAAEFALAQKRAALEKNQKAFARTESPLLNIPSNSGWQRACKVIIDELDLSQDGWELSQVACERTEVSAKWIKKAGATVNKRPLGRVSVTGDMVEQNIALGTFDRNEVDDSIDLQDAKSILRGWAQAAEFAISIVDVALPPVLPGADKATTPHTPPHANIALEVTISALDLDVSFIPGFRILKIVSTQSGWHIEGVLYGK